MTLLRKILWWNLLLVHEDNFKHLLGYQTIKYCTSVIKRCKFFLKYKNKKKMYIICDNDFII